MSEELSDVEIEGVMRYWEQPTGMANAPGGMVEAARSNLASFKATIDTLTEQVATLTGERDEWKAAVTGKTEQVHRLYMQQRSRTAAAEQRVKELEDVVDAARSEHYRVETVNSDGDDWEGCLCGMAWGNCKTLAALDALSPQEPTP